MNIIMINFICFMKSLNFLNAHQVKHQNNIRDINLVLDSSTLLGTLESLEKIHMQLESIAKKSSQT